MCSKEESASAYAKGSPYVRNMPALFSAIFSRLGKEIHVSDKINSSIEKYECFLNGE